MTENLSQQTLLPTKPAGQLRPTLPLTNAAVSNAEVAYGANHGRNWQRRLWYLLGWLLAALGLLLRKYARISWRQDPRPQLRQQGKRYVYALRHTDIFLALLINDEPQLAAMLSGSHHGELMLPLFGKRNVLPIRGSKRTRGRNKGGIAAAAQLAALAQADIPVLLAVDGPRGPLGKVALGIVEIALHADAVILPMVVRSSSTWHLPTWDRLKVPKLGSRLQVCIGTAIEPSQYANRQLIKEEIRQAFSQLDAS